MGKEKPKSIEVWPAVKLFVNGGASRVTCVIQSIDMIKANLIKTATMNYLLDSGVQWGGGEEPAVKGVRDAAIELLHTLVAVHAEVFAGCKPLLDKTLGILVEGLIDTFLSLFHENKTKDLRSLDANGLCRLMLELQFQTSKFHYCKLQMGMICIGQKHFRKALELLHNVVTAPMSTINAIAVEAYKWIKSWEKWIKSSRTRRAPSRTYFLTSSRS